MPRWVGRFGGCCEPSFFSHRVHRRCLKPGDHLYVWSSFAHHHHAVYVGAGRDVGYTPSVIHVYGDNKFASEVRRDTLNDFLRGRTIRRARYGVPWWHLYVKPAGTCYAFDKDDPEEIVQRAWRWLRADQFARHARRHEDHAAEQAEAAAANARARRGMLENAVIDAEGDVPAETKGGGNDSSETGGDVDESDVRVLRRMLRAGALKAEPEQAAIVTVADSPWIYDLFRRNCEHFTLLCTAPSKQSGSHQSQQLTRFNPLATLVFGALVRLNYYRRLSGVDDFFTRLFSDGRVAARRKAAARYAARTRFRGRMLRHALRWKAAGSRHRMRQRVAAFEAKARTAVLRVRDRAKQRATAVRARIPSSSARHR
eukprot:CAMPEP_0174838850 /NCGR_PEP_ID=MMETSP1114-20130205/7662_1 /TAXON_ID=312471 /ORGANISM="Neobodo designis, Strain CCAP 1951/1" /LENGTH=369 /DNA_ID=CAMNT_0016072961 /DNA_START=62 /DNA_END=1171 /DNA_ORIENTATION=+